MEIHIQNDTKNTQAPDWLETTKEYNVFNHELKNEGRYLLH